MLEVEQLVAQSHQYAAQAYRQQVFALIAERLKTYRERDAGYGNIGIYVEEIASGFSYGYDADRSELRPNGNYVGYFHTASVAKLLIAYVFYYLDDLGEVDIWQVHTDPVVGQQQQWQRLIHRMITHSVNLHHNIILRYLGSNMATQTLRELGLTQSTLSRELAPAPGTANATCLERYGTLDAPRTTPADLGCILASLARGNVLSSENNELFMQALTNTIYNSRIPKALNFIVPVAHKTGTKDHVYNDAALVLLPENEFVLVLLTRGAPNRIQSLMRDITRDLYEFHCLRRDSGEVEQIRSLNEWLARNNHIRKQKLVGVIPTSFCYILLPRFVLGRLTVPLVISRARPTARPSRPC
jgi:hypothetical protein